MRRALWLILAAPLLLLLAAPGRAETRWERSARQKREITKQVVWPNHEPLLFYLRRGRRDENWPQTYERQHSPENIKAMADAGVRYGRLHFYALSENLTKWAYYAAFPILRTARSSRLLTASRLALSRR